MDMGWWIGDGGYRRGRWIGGGECRWYAIVVLYVVASFQRTFEGMKRLDVTRMPVTLASYIKLYTL